MEEQYDAGKSFKQGYKDGLKLMADPIGTIDTLLTGNKTIGGSGWKGRNYETGQPVEGVNYQSGAYIGGKALGVTTDVVGMKILGGWGIIAPVAALYVVDLVKRSNASKNNEPTGF